LRRQENGFCFSRIDEQQKILKIVRRHRLDADEPLCAKGFQER
jgi:hypothetical protein